MDKKTIKRKKAPKKKARKKAAKHSNKHNNGVEKIAKLLSQAREPLSLIDVLKKEGVARLAYIIDVGTTLARMTAKKNIKSQIREFSEVVGLVSSEEKQWVSVRVKNLEARIERLEEKLDIESDDNEE